MSNVNMHYHLIGACLSVLNTKALVIAEITELKWLISDLDEFKIPCLVLKSRLEKLELYIKKQSYVQ